MGLKSVINTTVSFLNHLFISYDLQIRSVLAAEISTPCNFCNRWAARVLVNSDDACDHGRKVGGCLILEFRF